LARCHPTDCLGDRAFAPRESAFRGQTKGHNRINLVFRAGCRGSVTPPTDKPLFFESLAATFGINFTTRVNLVLAPTTVSGVLLAFEVKVPGRNPNKPLSARGRRQSPVRGTGKTSLCCHALHKTAREHWIPLLKAEMPRLAKWRVSRRFSRNCPCASGLSPGQCMFFAYFWGGCLSWDIRRENIVFDHPPNLINLVLSREEIVL